MYDIQYDPAARTVLVSVRGHFKPDQVDEFSAAVDAAAREAQSCSGTFDIIVESLEFPVQAQDVAEMLAGIMQRGMALTGGRAAVVVGSQLNRLQAERTLVHPRVRVFLSLDEAQAWLNEGESVIKMPQAL